jgi:hypothetical protein
MSFHPASAGQAAVNFFFLRVLRFRWMAGLAQLCFLALPRP